MKKLLVLHCWFGTPNDNWYTYLKEETKNLGYEVHIPQLIDKDNPTLDAWTNSALKDFVIDENTSIIGHSLGAVLTLKITQNSAVKIDKLILVSGWDFWDLTPEHKTFFDIPINHKKIIENCKKITIVHSTTDPFITIAQAEEMSKRLGADLVNIPNGGHIISKEFSEKLNILPIQGDYNEFPQLIDLLK